MQTTRNTILITGGTSGIGLAFAKEFLQSGNKVIICGRRQNRLAEIHQQHKGMVTHVFRSYVFQQFHTTKPDFSGGHELASTPDRDFADLMTLTSQAGCFPN